MQQSMISLTALGNYIVIPSDVHMKDAQFSYFLNFIIINYLFPGYFCNLFIFVTFYLHHRLCQTKPSLKIFKAFFIVYHVDWTKVF